MTRNNVKPSTDKGAEAKAEFAKLLAAAQTRGFYGTASLTLNLQDGHIQHLRVSMDRMVK
jgi:hypothetical protein